MVDGRIGTDLLGDGMSTENLMCQSHKATNERYREGWDRVFGERQCSACDPSKSRNLSDHPAAYKFAETPAHEQWICRYCNGLFWVEKASSFVPPHSEMKWYKDWLNREAGR